MTTLKAASLAQLRQIASDLDIVVDGDRRRKQSYVDAIQAWESANTSIGYAGETPASLSVKFDGVSPEDYEVYHAEIADDEFDSLIDTALAVNRGEITEEEAGISVRVLTWEEDQAESDDHDISVEELMARDAALQAACPIAMLEQQHPALQADESEQSPVSFAAVLLLICQVVLVVLALPVLLVGGLLKVVAWAFDSLASYIASSRHDGAWGRVQCWMLAV